MPIDSTVVKELLLKEGLFKGNAFNVSDQDTRNTTSRTKAEWIEYSVPRSFIRSLEAQSISFVGSARISDSAALRQKLRSVLLSLKNEQSLPELPSLHDEQYRFDVNTEYADLISLGQALPLEALHSQITKIRGQRNERMLSDVTYIRRGVDESIAITPPPFPSDNLCHFLIKEVAKVEDVCTIDTKELDNLKTEARIHIKNAIWAYFRTLADSIRSPNESTQLSLGRAPHYKTFVDSIAEGMVARVPVGFNDWPTFVSTAYQELLTAAARGEVSASSWRLKADTSMNCKGNMILEAFALAEDHVQPHPERTNYYDLVVVAPGSVNDSL